MGWDLKYLTCSKDSKIKILWYITKKNQKISKPDFTLCRTFPWLNKVFITPIFNFSFQAYTFPPIPINSAQPKFTVIYFSCLHICSHRPLASLRRFEIRWWWNSLFIFINKVMEHVIWRKINRFCWLRLRLMKKRWLGS